MRKEEKEMIKEAIEKIEAMAKPQVLEIGDHTFACPCVFHDLHSFLINQL